MKLIKLSRLFIIIIFMAISQNAFAASEKAISEKAIFAGGCFWCMEPPYEKLDGVISAVSGYVGGKEKKPSYNDVAYGKTGHTEAVEITFNPEKISYETLLEVFWMQIDPTTPNAQFVDHGAHYRTGIFYTSEEQRVAALKSKEKTQALGLHKKPFVTEITKASRFWPAEEYHQDYYKKNPIRYKFYRFNSGRDQYLDKVWGDKRKYQ